MTTDNANLREHVLYLLRGGGAHIDFDAAIDGLPAKLRGARPKDLPYSPWELLEHMRLAQWDILEFSRNPRHDSPEWPKGYWPETPGPPDGRAWDSSVDQIRGDNEAMQALVADETNDLLAPFSHGDGQTLLREALLVADHNAYHVGQLIVVRRLLGAWR